MFDSQLCGQMKPAELAQVDCVALLAHIRGAPNRPGTRQTFYPQVGARRNAAIPQIPRNSSTGNQKRSMIPFHESLYGRLKSKPGGGGS
jgi:hypothetical protein